MSLTGARAADLCTISGISMLEDSMLSIWMMTFITDCFLDRASRVEPMNIIADETAICFAPADDFL